MQKRALGSTGIDVSVLGLGTVKIGRNQQVKYPTGFELPDDDSVVELFELARSLGINFIDTAPAYGSSEQRLGELLPDHHDWVIVTKVGEIFENGKSRFDFSYDYTVASIEQSLRKLRRDVLDVVLVHSDGNDMDIINREPVFDALESVKNKGLIKAYGMSSKTVEGGSWVVQHCDVVMATANLEYDDERPVLELAEKLNKGVIIKKGLQSGHADSASGGTGVEAAFRHILGQPGVSSMIVGTINKQHLRDNVAIVNELMK
ncbi:MAG: aldo/keto reductase [Gammaproteobacteria bacterium]|nr:aldo/keto reductase [Gammaproteobacteria bacterium]MBT8133136.1 aldo/keto reductase [Gammaproteobacteria bacterium]NNJ49135.1 aldo/keto reductase [Gammaproteobacteria bacterium]